MRERDTRHDTIPAAPASEAHEAADPTARFVSGQIPDPVPWNDQQREPTASERAFGGEPQPVFLMYADQVRFWSSGEAVKYRLASVTDSSLDFRDEPSAFIQSPGRYTLQRAPGVQMQIIRMGEIVHSTVPKEDLDKRNPNDAGDLDRLKVGDKLSKLPDRDDAHFADKREYVIDYQEGDVLRFRSNGRWGSGWMVREPWEQVYAVGGNQERDWTSGDEGLVIAPGKLVVTCGGFDFEHLRGSGRVHGRAPVPIPEGIDRGIVESDEAERPISQTVYRVRVEHGDRIVVTPTQRGGGTTFAPPAFEEAQASEGDGGPSMLDSRGPAFVSLNANEWTASGTGTVSIKVTDATFQIVRRDGTSVTSHELVPLGAGGMQGKVRDLFNLVNGIESLAAKRPPNNHAADPSSPTRSPGEREYMPGSGGW